MSPRSRSAAKPIADLLGKRLSTATVMFHAAVADRMGVSVTDAKCRSILLQLGPMTAGALAEHLGLTTGAVTGVINRLERARFVRRLADPKDRRHVLVEPVANRERDGEIALLFAPMAKRVRALAAAYDEHDQAVIAEFMTKACAIMEAETARLRASR